MQKRGLSTTDAIWLLVGMVAVAVIVVVGYNYYGELEEEDIPGNVTNMTNQTVEDSCILTNAIWGADYVFIDEEVTLTVFGEDCDGEDLRVEIFDSSDELVNEVEGIQLENGIAIMEWEAGSEWEGGIYLLLIPILTIYVMGTYRVRTMRHYEMFFLIVTILVIVGLLLAFSSRVQYQPVVEETYYFTAVLESNSSMFVQSPELDVGEQVIPESCGNGIIEGGEECDDGNSDNNDECLNSCLLASCGDGLVWDGEEECDDGDSDNSDQCLNSCQPASCGDGIVQQGVEECDDGNDVNSDECTNSCEVAICGDGIVQQGVEECDDGNTVNSDACTNSCQTAYCGDGILWQGQEECDDGNINDTDECSNSCEIYEEVPICYGSEATEYVTCDYRLSLQGKYVDETIIPLDELEGQYGVSNDAVTIHSSALGSGVGVSLEDALAMTEETLIQAMNNYLNNNPDIEPNTTDLLLLDIEHALHPRNLWEYNESMQLEIIEAFKLRYNVTRQIFPNAKFAAWFINSPLRFGQVNDAFADRTESFIFAGEQGMFDQIDYLTPQMYTMHGPNDDNYLINEEARIRTGVEYTQIINDSQGNPIPLAPALSFVVFNPNSQHQQQLVSTEVAQMQVDVLQEYESVEIIQWWWGTTKEEIPEYYQNVGPVPLECFCGI